MVPPAESPNQNNDTVGTAGEGRPSVPFLTKLFASGLLSGYSPVASGTVGSAVGLAFYWIPGFEHPLFLCLASVCVFVLGVFTGTAMEKVYGHDPAEVTIDEVLGMWISLILLPKTILISVIAFFVFRIFDIVKPFPARRFDKLHGGAAIMLDDVICGVYTNLLLQLAVALKILS